MRPARITATVVFAATVGMLTLLAAPASAESRAAPFAVHVSPSPVAAGHAVTLSGSVGPDAAGTECSGVTLLSKAFVHTYDFAEVPAVIAAVKPDGAFAATTRIPRSKAAGTYTITGRCGGGNLGASARLVVRAAVSPPTTAAPTPPATGPSLVQPAVAAPAASGPPTPPASPVASRWMIPWLAALGSGTLAALGMWLWYRRHHPASLGRY